MKGIQHPDSSFAVNSSLDLFSVLPTAVGAKSFRVREIPPIHPVTSDGPFEFHVQSQYMIDLSKTYVYCKFAIYNDQGQPHPLLAERVDANGVKSMVASTRVAPVQALAKALFNHATVTVDGVQVEDIPLFHYKSFFEFEYTASPPQKAQLSRNLLYSVKDDGTDNVANPGYLERHEWCKGGAVHECQFRPALALFQQDKLWLKNTELRIRFNRNGDTILINNYDANQAPEQYHLHIVDMRLLVNEVDVEEPAIVNMEAALASGRNALYNIRPVEMRSFHVASGRREYEVVLSNTPKVPLRVLLAFVPNDSFHGAQEQNRSVYNFVPGNVYQISLMLSGANVGYASPFPIRWNKKQYMRVFQAHLDNLGISNTSNGISFDDFGKHRALYTWCISPHSEDACLNMVEPGILSVKITFDTALTESLMMIAYLEETSVLQLTSSRNVATTHSMTHV